MFLRKRDVLFVSMLLSVITIVSFASGLSASLVPQTGHCFTPLTVGPYSGDYVCTNNITTYDGIMARIKIDSTGPGWINSTWATNISNTSVISSAIVNTSVQVTAMANVILQTQIFNSSAVNWINVSGCNYTFTSSNNVENKLCDISAYVSRGIDISSLIVRSFAYRTSGGGAEEQFDMQVLSLIYNPESPPTVFLDAPMNGTVSPTMAVAFNATLTDDNALRNVTLYIWNSTNSLINTTTRTLNGTQNQTSITVMLPYDGIFLWNYLAGDSGGNNAFNATNFTITLDQTAPGISFVNPLSANYSTTNILVNISANGASNIWFFNGTTNVTYTSPEFYNFSDGSHSIIAYANDTIGNLNSTQIMFSVDTIFPTVTVLSPINGSTLGNNQSIPFNFSVIENNLANCWYNLDGGVNFSLSGCINTSLNTSNGNHIIRLYANDSAGNTGSSSTSFSVQVGAPSISLISPINNYLNYGEGVSLIYIPSDIDLFSCSLWGNFNGTFSKNQTYLTPISSVQNSFSVDLIDGTYLWAISCNDSIGNNAMSANQTFFVDTILPNVSLSAPSGTYTSLSNIPITLSVSDASPVQCRYNITFAATGNTVVGNSELSNCASTTFTLDTESSYFFNLLVNDSAGNTNITRKSFTVSIPGTGSSSSGSSSGGSGGSGGSGTVSGLNSFSLSLGVLDKLKINRGDSESIELPVINKGLRFLNNCHFFARGGVSNWISGEDVQSLSPGQTIKYIFNVNIPIDAEVGDYFVTLGANCAETNATFTYGIEVTGGEFEVTILNSERIGTRLRVEYAIENFGDKTKNITVNYKLLGKEDNIIVDGSVEPVEVLAGERFEGTTEFELPKNSIGDYSLVIEATDGLNKAQKEQEVRFTSGGISGFAISEGNSKALSWGGIVVLLSFGIYLVLKTIRHQLALRRANSELNRQFIAIDLNH